MEGGKSKVKALADLMGSPPRTGAIHAPNEAAEELPETVGNAVSVTGAEPSLSSSPCNHNTAVRYGSDV